MTRFLVLAAFLGANVVAAAPPEGIERVEWMQGCWELQAGDRVVEEQWSAPRSGTMIGMGRTLRGNSLVEYELIVLRVKDGALVYHAHPSGQPSAEFPLKEAGERHVIFENAAHDFPQRVGYSRTGDALVAWVEGTRNGSTRRIEFPYRRVACPGR